MQGDLVETIYLVPKGLARSAMCKMGARLLPGEA